MIMTASGGVQGKVSDIQVCAGCNKKIHDKYVLKVSTSSSSLPSLTVLIQAMDLFWHEDCLKCGCCDARLGEVGQSLYTKGNLLLCKRDYLRSGLLHPTSFSHRPLFRLFGSTGYCAACKKIIPAFEMVMRARTRGSPERSTASSADATSFLEAASCQAALERWRARAD